MTAHDQATQRDVGRFPVGQNIAATWTTRRPSNAQDATPDFNKQIHAWFDEVRAYGYKPTGYSHGTGHYSQVSIFKMNIVLPFPYKTYANDLF